MCFSAAGSFAVAGLMAGIGVASIRRSASPPHGLFAAIPLIFAAQQAAEGVVWLTFDPAAATLHSAAETAFLGLALILWPTWLPIALHRMERNAARKRVLSWMIGAGCVVSITAFAFLIRWEPSSSVAGHSIRYDFLGMGHMQRNAILLLAYAIPTIIPFFISTASLARTIGISLVLSLIAAAVVRHDALTSVWCFFAAILSCQVLVAIDRENRRLMLRVESRGHLTADA